MNTHHYQRYGKSRVDGSLGWGLRPVTLCPATPHAKVFMTAPQQSMLHARVCVRARLCLCVCVCE